MKRRNSSPSITAAAEQKLRQAAQLKAQSASPQQPEQKLSAQAVSPAAAKSAAREFSVRIVRAQEAEDLPEMPDRALLQPDCLAFLLCGGAPHSQGDAAPLGYCIIRSKAAPAPSAQSGKQRETAPSSRRSGGFLEIAAFRLYDALAEGRAAARAKTLLLRAVADYYRRREVEYICGQFAFAGKYPAAYAREFSCLYHYYRMKDALPQIRMADAGADRAEPPARASMDIMPAEAAPPGKSRRLLPPMLRYCLKLGAKADGSVTIDRSSNHGNGAMNVFLAMPLRPVLKTDLRAENIPKTG